MIEHRFEPSSRWSATDVPMLCAAVRAIGGCDEEAAELIDQIAALEELKCVATAAQARATAAFAAKQQ